MLNEKRREKPLSILHSRMGWAESDNVSVCRDRLVKDNLPFVALFV